MPATASVSVVIPVYNGERFLAEAIESACWQTHRPKETIVVDDGSTDGSAAITRAWPGVRCISQANAGLATARNTGIEAASGDFVALLDADDIWTPDKLALQLEALAAAPDAGYASSWHRDFFEPGEPVNSSYRTHLGDEPSGGLPSSWLVRRETFPRVGLFDPAFEMAEDADWHLRATDADVPPVLVREVLVLRRRHDSNLSWDFTRGRFFMFAALRASAGRKRRLQASRGAAHA
ncbi:MAG: glycosyltransferase family 2 protein [Tepidiformaceae bacterium]